MRAIEQQVSLVRALVGSAAVGALSPGAGADVLDVPAGYPTIQAAIDAAAGGDEIVVAPGTYPEQIDLLGKALTLRSSEGPAVTTIDAQQAGPTVRCSSGEGPDTVLQGLTITGGSESGLRCIPGSPTVNDCVFIGNLAHPAGPSGGAVRAGDGGYPSFHGCTFEANFALSFGAAILVQGEGPEHLLVIEDCSFIDNVGQDHGTVAAMGVTLLMTNCTFEGNLASRGGALYLAVMEAHLDGCAFIDNVADGSLPAFPGHGGAVYWNWPLPSSTVTDCTFEGNSSVDAGGAMYIFNSQYDLTVSGCTFTGNSCELEGGGLFVEGTENDVVVMGSSFCENAPDHAFGFVENAGGNEVCDCEGDLDGDGFVGVNDLVEVVLAWGQCPAPPDPCPADLDGDGMVGVDDLVALLLDWGSCL